MISEWAYECKGCPCAEARFSPCRRGPNAEVAIIVDHPTALDQAKKSLLNGDSGNLVKLVLKEFGIRTSSCYVTTALNCRPNVKKEAMMKKSMLGCKDRLIDELKVAGVKRVLCLGGVGFSQLMDAERNLPITKVRGRWEQRNGMDILATFNPGWLFGEPDYFRDFTRDIEKFCTTDPEPSPNIELWYPESVREMKEAFAELSGASYVSCDTETTGISVYNDDILALGFGAMFPGTHDGLAVVLHESLVDTHDCWESVAEYLSNENLASVFHNAKFDLKFLRKYLIMHGLKYLPRNIQDTMLLNYCQDERPMGRFGSHSLKNMSRIRCDAPDYDIQMGKWLKEWATASPARRAEMRVQMHEYLAFDVYFTARMYPDLVNEVMEEDPQLMHHYQNLLLPGTLALAEIEMYGAPVNRKFFEEQWAYLQETAAPILERIKENTGLPEFNPISPKQVADYLYVPRGQGGWGLPVLKTARRGKLQEGKTSKQILKMLRKNLDKFTESQEEVEELSEFITDVLAYRNYIKSAGTYVKGLLSRMDPDDRIRCDLLLHGTSTGRLSSQNPNLQNIPESSHTGVEIRAGYIAPPGWLMFNADYSQLELRVAAWLSADENFTAAYIEGRDFHQEVVTALYGTTKEDTTPYMRYLAKCCTFGVLYGRGAKSLALGPEMDYAEENFGAKRWTVDEAQGFFDRFFTNFSRFKEWTEEIAKFAYENQYVQTPFGNKRRFPFIPRNDNGAVHRQAVNTPIQGTAALLTVSALIRIHNQFKVLNDREGKTVAHLILTVHDSIMGVFNPHYLDEVRKIVIYEMQDNLPLETSVPFKADFEFAPNWGIVKDWNAEDNLPAYLGEEEEVVT